MTHIPPIVPQEVEIADGPVLDAFGRVRMSEPVTLFDSKQINDNQPLLWDDQQVSGSGTSSTWSQDEARSRLAVSATTAGRRVRQTFMRFNYQPGKSQLAMLTARIVNAGAGVKGCVGLFDDENGVFFTSDEGTVKAVIRSKATGSVVDTEVAQASWNGDKMDGTGPSGATLDPSKTQILWFDYEWLGVGRVRMGFVIDGKLVVAHTFPNSNLNDRVYMSTPNLPLRFEIENDGTGVAADMDAICATVSAEGGMAENGVLRENSTGGTAINANSTSAIYAVCALRLQSDKLGTWVDMLGVDMLAMTADNFEWVLLLNPAVAASVTFNAEANSGVEFAVGNAGNPSTSTLTGGTRIAGGYGHENSHVGEILLNSIRLGAAIDGTRDEIYLGVRPLTTNLDILGSLAWRESP